MRFSGRHELGDEIMADAGHEFLLPQFPHVFEALFLAHDLEHAAEPIYFSGLNHHLSLPHGQQQIVPAARNLFFGNEARVIGDNIGIGVDCSPIALFLKFLRIEGILRRDIITEDLTLPQRVHRQTQSLNRIGESFLRPRFGEDLGKQSLSARAVQFYFKEWIFLLEA